MSLHVAQSLPEAPQASQRSLLTRVIQETFRVKAGGQTHHFPEPIDDGRLAVLIPRDNHVKAVGAKVHRRHDRSGIAAGL